MDQRPSQHQVPITPGDGAGGGAGGGDPGAGASAGRGAGAPPPEPSHAERCRTLVASTNRAALSTVAVDPPGYPYGSVTTYALDDTGNPLLFVSTMAEHTQNAARDPRASLLVAEPVPDGGDPLAAGRVTLLGDLAVVPDGDERAAVRDRYLAANPSAAYYAEFGDFVFLRLTVRSIRYVGGYGRMSWVDAARFAAAERDPLAGAPAAAILAHMNADHAEAQVLYCRHLAGRPDTTSATMSSVDRYGFEMIATGPSGRAAVRLGFPEPCSTTDEVRVAMIALVADARARSRP